MAYRGCEICKKPIETERAEGVPETRLCVQHAHEIGKYGGEFRTVVNEDLTSKHGSLKKNYGGVTVYRRRNVEALLRLRDAYEALTA
jgi:hypothetical protein